MGLNINSLLMLFKEDYNLYELNKEDIFEKTQILKSCIDEELFSSAKLVQNELLLELEVFTKEYENLFQPVGKIIIEVFGDRFKPIELLSRDDVDFISENREKIEELFNIFLFFMYSHHKLLNDFNNLYSKHRNFLTKEQKRGDAIAVYMHCLKTTDKTPTIEMLEYSSHMVLKKAYWEKKYKNRFFWDELKENIEMFIDELTRKFLNDIPPEIKEKIEFLWDVYKFAEDKYKKLYKRDLKIKAQHGSGYNNDVDKIGGKISEENDDFNLYED